MVRIDTIECRLLLTNADAVVVMIVPGTYCMHRLRLTNSSLPCTVKYLVLDSTYGLCIKITVKIIRGRSARDSSESSRF